MMGAKQAAMQRSQKKTYHFPLYLFVKDAATAHVYDWFGNPVTKDMPRGLARSLVRRMNTRAGAQRGVAVQTTVPVANSLVARKTRWPLSVGTTVAHQGESIGKIKEIRPTLPTGRAYALIQPHELLHDTRRLPLDELVEVTP